MNPFKRNKSSNTGNTRQTKRIKFTKIRFIKWIPKNVADILISALDSIKQFFVYRSFWGRGSAYKQVIHVVVVIITVMLALSGVSYRIFGLNASSEGLSVDYFATVGNVDLLQQGNSLQSVLASSPLTPFKVNYYRVADGDSLQSIADKLGVSKETIKWSNTDKFGTYNTYNEETVNPGEELKIPEVNGVLWEIRDGDSLDSILEKTNGDRFSTIEVNQLAAFNNSISGRKLLLVPNGSLPAPQPVFTYSFPSRARPAAGDCGVSGEIDGVALSNPLCHPSCEGYGWSRGLIWGDGGYLYHDGVDLSRGGGCPISAMCDGVVTRTGWEDGGGGYVVRIDCGNGVNTLFYHGDGNIWVSAGQSVSRGDPVMYMGCTGLCTGTHLHFILRTGGVTVDPSNYVGF